MENEKTAIEVSESIQLLKDSDELNYLKACEVDNLNQGILRHEYN